LDRFGADLFPILRAGGDCKARQRNLCNYTSASLHGCTTIQEEMKLQASIELRFADRWIFWRGADLVDNFHAL
jgi:hypothetical protein